MSYPLRFQKSEWAMQHIVSRCLNGFSFLKPTSEVTQICAGVLGRSLHVYSDRINLITYAFLSNHFHLLLESKDAHSLAEFMKYFKSNLTRELARIHDWQGTMWQSRYSSEEILDEESLIEVFKYINENSVKEGLVDHPRAWEGLHGFHQLVDQRPLIGPWVDRTAMFNASKRLKRRDQIKVEDFTINYKIELKKPRIWSKMTDEEYYERCTKICDEAINSARSKRLGHPIGMKRVLAEPVLRARRQTRGRGPLCRAKTVERFKEYQAQYRMFKRAFQAAYKYAQEQVSKGLTRIDMLFPSGGIPPMSLRSLSSLPKFKIQTE